MMIRNHFLMIRVLQIIISYEGKTEQMIMNNPIEKKTCEGKHKPILLASSGLLNRNMFCRSLPGTFKLLGLTKEKVTT